MSESGRMGPPPSACSTDSTPPRRSLRIRTSNSDTSGRTSASWHSLLADNTEIDVPRRKSWWKKVDNNSINIKEVFGDKAVDGQPFDVENFVQAIAGPSNIQMGKLALRLDNMSDSSTSESLASIQIPQRKLFTQRQIQQLTESENINKHPKQTFTTNMEQVSDNSEESLQSIQLHQRKLFIQKKTKQADDFVKIMKKRESIRKSMNEKTVHVSKKHLFSKDKTKENRNTVQNKKPVVFPFSIMSDTDDDTLEVQDRLTVFNKIPQVITRSRRASASSRLSKRAHSPASFCSETMEIEEWRLLPSSTMIGENIITSTPAKKLCREKTNAEDVIMQNKEHHHHEVITDIVQDEQNFQEKQATYDNNAVEIRDVSKSKSKDKSKIEEKDKSILEQRDGCDVEQENKSKGKDKSETKQRNKSKLYRDDEIFENNLNKKNESAIEVYNQDMDAQSKDNDFEEDKSVLGTDNESNDEQEKSGIQNDVDNQSQEKNDCLDNMNENTEKNENIKTNENTHKKCNTHRQSENYNIDNENLIEDRSNKKNTVESDNEVASEVESAEQENDRNSLDESSESEVEQNHSQNESRKQQNDTQDANNSQKEKYASQEENNDNREEVNESQEEVNESQEEGHESQEEVNESQDEVNESQDEVNESQEEVHESQEDVHESQEEVNESQEEVHESQEEVHESQEEVNESQEEVHESQEEVHESQEEVHESQEEVNESQEEVNESQEEDNRTEGQNESEEQNMSLEEENVSELNSEEQDAKSDNHNKEADNSEQECTEDMDVPEDNEMQSPIEGSCENGDEDVNQEENKSDDEDDDFRVLSFKNRQNDTTRSNKSKSIRVSQSGDEMSNNTSKNNSPQVLTKNINSMNIDPGRMSTAEHSNRYSADFYKNISGGARSSIESSGWNSHTTAYIQRAEQTMNARKSLRASVLSKSVKVRPSAKQIEHSVDDVEHDFTSPATPTQVQNDTTVNGSATNQSINMTQTNITEYLNNIAQDNLQHRQKIQEKVKRSLKKPVTDPNCERTYFQWSKQMPQAEKKNSKNAKRNKDLNILVTGAADQAHKAPKLFKPPRAPWINETLYKFLYAKMLPIHKDARYRCEKFVHLLYEMYKHCMKKTTDPRPLERALKEKMALMGLVTTHFEFYKFVEKYMPKEFGLKMIPNLFNGLPVPADVYADIITQHSPTF